MVNPEQQQQQRLINPEQQLQQLNKTKSTLQQLQRSGYNRLSGSTVGFCMGIKNKIHEGYLYYLTLTVVDWVDVFTRPVYRHIIIDSLKFCQEKKGLEIYAWVLMSNHLHLIASAKEGFHLSNILRDFKKFTSRSLVEAIQKENESRKEWMLHRFQFPANVKSKVTNHQFWQEGNEAKEIHSNEFLQQKLNYIHQNPVRAEWVLEPEHYLYSSAQDYAGMPGLLKVLLPD
ncbi:hypothetical protein GCM10011405_10710 [Rufibacter glacialis]|nr:hypothetical protein GCM10011405_10710 [Rufibacter glacialis]